VTDRTGKRGDERLLFHLSDIHFGLVDERAIEWVASEIERCRPDAVAITGDLTMRARHREFAAACHWIQALDVPVTVEIGNHDMPYFNLIERFFAPYRRFRAIEGLIEREIDLPGIAIVPLKTAVRAQPRFNWSKGWVSRSALKKSVLPSAAMAGPKMPSSWCRTGCASISAPESGSVAASCGRRGRH